VAIVDRLRHRHRHRHRWTRADYALLQYGHLRCELVDGEIIDAGPMSNRHRQAVLSIIESLIRLSDPAVVNVGGRAPVVLDDSSEPEPDAWVARGPRRSYIERNVMATDLMLVVEVADSSLRFDRDVKLPLYARCEIPEVWIVDLVAQRVFVHREPAGGTYSNVMQIESNGAVELPWGGELAVDHMLNGAP
jgi:Uma2 family endonuclease